jgi:hypothetical protein
MRDDEFWLRPRSPAPRPDSVAILDRAREALAELAGLSSTAQLIERLEEVLTALPDAYYVQARKLAALQEALRGGGPEVRREGTIAEAAGRTA